MNQNIAKLVQVANKPERCIVGLMSGTSVDGLDIALCYCSGSGINTKIRLEHFETAPYNSEYKENVAALFSKRNVDLESLCLIHAWIGSEHGKLILKSLEKWGLDPAQVDLIASHGQTIYHAPKSMHKKEAFGNATLQIGDGDHIAVTTGIITISDFRQKHIAAGGEGAPLAVYGDYLLFGKKGENRILLNIGGIANFTFLPANMDFAEIFSTDVGPGNTMMDAYSRKYYNCAYDPDGALANKGEVNTMLLAALENHPFFKIGFPKTTGPEIFNLDYLQATLLVAGCTEILQEDCMRTLNQFTANQIASAIQRSCPVEEKISIYTSGGGMHNTLLMENLKHLLPRATFYSTATLGVLPDAKEAVLFALLANEAVTGNPLNNKKAGNGIPMVNMGKISFPE